MCTKASRDSARKERLNRPLTMEARCVRYILHPTTTFVSSSTLESNPIPSPSRIGLVMASMFFASTEFQHNVGPVGPVVDLIHVRRIVTAVVSFSAVQAVFLSNTDLRSFVHFAFSKYDPKNWYHGNEILERFRLVRRRDAIPMESTTWQDKQSIVPAKRQPDFTDICEEKYSYSVNPHAIQHGRVPLGAPSVWLTSRRRRSCRNVHWGWRGQS